MLDRLHQADIALLDQVEQISRRPRELVGNLDHQPQVRGDQAVGVVGVVILCVAFRDYGLFFTREQRKAPNFSEIAAERIEWNQGTAVRADAAIGLRGIDSAYR